MSTMEYPRPLLEIQDGDAAVVAAWYAVAYDLQHVIAATKTLLSLLQQHEHNQTLVRSLWASALVSYVRCFTSGRRVRLDPTIFADLAGDPIGTHQYYKDTRDKHIAHPVNAFEEVRVGLLLDDSGEAVGVGHLAAFRICDAPEGVEQLGKLATVALRYVMSLLKPLEDALLARARLEAGSHSSFKPLRIQPQGGGQAARIPRSTRG